MRFDQIAPHAFTLAGEATPGIAKTIIIGCMSRYLL